MYKKLMSLFICLLLVLPLSYVTVKAGVNSSTSVSTNSPEISSIVSQTNSTSKKEYGKSLTILKYTKDKGILSFNNTNYAKLSVDSKKIVMDKALSATKESSLGNQQKNRVYNFIAKQDESVSSAIKYLKTDVSADFVEAKEWFEPFSGPISSVLGFLSILIFVFLALSIMFDLCYMLLPGFQFILERGEPHKRPFGVSVEAWKTTRYFESNSDDNRSILTVYLQKRIPSMFLIALSLGYLISGKIYDLLVFCMDSFNIFK